jgi:hypothetical protein
MFASRIIVIGRTLARETRRQSRQEQYKTSGTSSLYQLTEEETTTSG